MTRDENTWSSYHVDLELSDRSRDEIKIHSHGYHVDLELSDRSRE